MLALAVVAVFAFCMVFAAISDLLSMTIANGVSIFLAVAFVPLALLAGLDLQAIGWHLSAGALVLIVTFGLFVVNAMGGGDAKLLSATAIWMGLDTPLMEYLTMSAFAGGLLTVLIVAYRWSPLAAPSQHRSVLRHLADRQAGIPYGIALGIGGLLAFPHTALGVMALARLSNGSM